MNPLIDINDIINLNNFAIKTILKLLHSLAILILMKLKNENIVKVICNESLEKNKFSSAKIF